MQAKCLLIALFLLLSAEFAQSQAIFLGQNRSVGPQHPIASATVAGSCSQQMSSPVNAADCIITTGTSAGDLGIVNFTFFDNHTITPTSSCGGTLSLIAVTPAYPNFWNGEFYTYSYKFKNLSSSSSCTFTATDTNTPGSNPWISAVVFTGCTAMCDVDQGSTLSLASNTIAATPITTSVANEMLVTFCALKAQNDPISASNTPQTMTPLRQPSSGVLVGSSVAAVAGSGNYTQCTGTFGDVSEIDIVAIR
jgi:hypothetical protein